MAHSITLNDIPGVDAIEHARRVSENPDDNTPLDWVPEANRYFTTVGFTPGRGSFLIDAKYIDKLDLTKKLKLRIGDQFGNIVEFPNLRCAGDPRCISAGSSAPLYLIPLTDRRVDLMATTNLRFQWRYFPDNFVDLNSQYAGGTGFNPTVAGSEINTWALVIETLWNQLAGDLGAWPGLPSTVVGPNYIAVDQLDLCGWRTVDALEDCLAAISCAAVYNPRTDAYSIVYFPRAEDHAVRLFQQYRDRLAYDEAPYTPPRFGPIPSRINVLFPVWKGGRTQTNVREYFAITYLRSYASALQWSAGAELVDGTVYLQDFTPARLNQANGHFNTVVIGNRYEQVARMFLERLTNTAPMWPLKRVYHGVLTDDRVVPGGTFDLVGWGLGAEGATTFVARAGLVGNYPIYTETPVSNGVSTGMPRTPLKRDDGTLMRVGGFAADVDSERAAFGWCSGPAAGEMSVGGWSAFGPLFQRGSALRQGDWVSVGGGAKTDRRSRLWKNWEGGQPHDCDRFVEVTSATATTITIDNAFGSSATIAAYPASVLQQVGTPDQWTAQETCWLVGANGLPLVPKVYDARLGNLASDGKMVWATENTVPEYRGYYTLADQTISTSSSYTDVGPWYSNLSTGPHTHPIVPTAGIWDVTVQVSGMAESIATTGAPSEACQLVVIVAWGNNTTYVAPGASGGVGIVASAFATNAAGNYRGTGSAAVRMLFEARDGLNSLDPGGPYTIRVWAFVCTEGFGIVLGPFNGTIYGSSGGGQPGYCTSVIMKKIGD